MTLKELGTGIVVGGAKVVKAVGEYIINASIADLVKIGVVVGSAVVTAYFGVKKLIEQIKLYRNHRHDRRDGTGSRKTMADMTDILRTPKCDDETATTQRPADIRALLDELNGKFDDKLRRKSKAAKRLSKKELEALRRAGKKLDALILGDDYDPTIDYFDPVAIRRNNEFFRTMARKKQYEEALRKKRAEYCEPNELVNIFHGYHNM